MRSSFSRFRRQKVATVGDSTMQVIEYALKALEQRAQVVANNVANSEVPGFRAERLEFEGELARAIDGDRVDRLGGPTVFDAGGAGDPTGNTVDLENEVVEMMRNNLLQQAMVEAYNFKSGLMRTAIRGQ